MFEYRYERPEDISAIRHVHLAAFETKTEANLVDSLRDHDEHMISMVALEFNKIVGHILFSPVTIATGGSVATLLGLAPMAVLPEYQRQGVGSSLVEKGLDECVKKDFPAVVVLGYPLFYRRFGFVSSIKYGIISEYDVPPDVFMILEMHPGALNGIYGTAKYHNAFAGQ